MNKEKVYIGTKIVKAISKTMHDFAKFKNRPYEGEDAPGYMVTYEDGYVSWSPKETFERSYRKVTESEVKIINS